jgi:hypothetical protein
MHILRHVDLTRVFFVDIETVPGHATHDELPEAHQPLWKKFCEKRHAKELADGLTHAELFAHCVHLGRLLPASKRRDAGIPS